MALNERWWKMMFNIFDALTPSYNCWFRTVVVLWVALSSHTAKLEAAQGQYKLRKKQVLFREGQREGPWSIISMCTA
jgi:hypothetical protein